MGALDFNECYRGFNLMLDLVGLGLEPANHGFANVKNSFGLIPTLRYAAGQRWALGHNVAVFAWSEDYR